MSDFKRMLSTCWQNSTLSEAVIDDFLMYYAGARDGLDEGFDRKLRKYRQMMRYFAQSTVNMFKAQYVTHKIFKRGGLIGKYLNQRAVKDLSEEQRGFLAHHAAHPWRFCYSVIVERPAEDFYVMEDVFADKEFLLYSPSITKILNEQPVILWFNLISFNGMCWQSYGPIGSFSGFTPDDIFFFTTQVSPGIESAAEVIAQIEKDPTPYMMLLGMMNTPVIMHKRHEVVNIISECHDISIDPDDLSKDFQLETLDGITRLALKKKDEFPHFAVAYYDPGKNLLLLTAMTHGGFKALVKTLRAYTLTIAPIPDIRVHLPMLTATEKILGKRITPNPYEDLFSVEAPEEEQAELDSINQFLQMVMAQINAGKEPDIAAVAEKAGVDINTATEIYRNVADKFDEMRGK